jgi:hypothetical protein
MNGTKDRAKERRKEKGEGWKRKSNLIGVK